MKIASIMTISLTTASMAYGLDQCYTLEDGEGCTNKQGQPSRCYYSICRDLPEPCEAGAKELQQCSILSYCFPFTKEGELMCLKRQEILSNLAFDGCVGKNDGDACKAISMSYTYDGSYSALFESMGKCSHGSCVPPSQVACDGKNEGDTCSFEGVVKEKQVKVTGTCKKDGIYKPSCEGTSQEVGNATPVKIYDTSKSIPTYAPITMAPATDGPTPAPTPSPAVTMKYEATHGSRMNDTTSSLGDLTNNTTALIDSLIDDLVGTTAPKAKTPAPITPTPTSAASTYVMLTASAMTLAIAVFL